MLELETKLPHEERRNLLETLGELDKILGYVKDVANQDSLTDLWEQQFLMGEEPDLDMTVDDLK